MRARAFFLLSASVGIALTAACAASLDLDRFTKAEAPLLPDGSTQEDAPDPATVQYLDLFFEAKGMNAHFNQLLELRVVDKDHRVQFKLLSENIQFIGGVATGSLDFSFYMKGCIPKSNPPYRIDFWADNNNNAVYDGQDGGAFKGDHEWRRVLNPPPEPLPPDVQLVGTRYEFKFLHDTTFVNIYKDPVTGEAISPEPFLAPFKLKVTNIPSQYLGKMLEMRIVNTVTSQLVGMHRRGAVPGEYDVTITDIIGDALTPYEVSAYVDMNANERYDAEEPSWKLPLTSAVDGVSGTFDVGISPQSPIETGQPPP